MLSTHFFKTVNSYDGEIKGVSQLKQPVLKTEEVRPQSQGWESPSETLGLWKCPCPLGGAVQKKDCDVCKFIVCICMRLCIYIYIHIYISGSWDQWGWP